MIGFLLLVAINAALFVIGQLLQPKVPDAKKQDQNAPRSTEGDAIPLLYGTVKVAPNCAWFQPGAPRAIRRSSGLFSKTTVGYEYYQRSQMLFCLGTVTKIVDIVFDDTRYFSQQNDSSLVTGTLPFTVPTAPGSLPLELQIKASSLYGGLVSGEGGTRGILEFYPGTMDQPASTFLATAAGQNRPVSAYKGVCYVIMKADQSVSFDQDFTDFGGHTGYHGFLLGSNPTMKSFHLVLSSFPQGAAIGNDANPVWVIYDLLTNAAALKIPTAKIDLTSFTNAAATCASEGMGISALLPSDQAEQHISQIQDHIDARVYSDPTTGLIMIRLIRDDYDHHPDSGLLELKPTMMSDFRWSRGAPTEWLTEVNVSYTAQYAGTTALPEPAYKTRTQRVQNPAAYFGIGEEKRIGTLDMPLFTTAANAYRAGLTYLKTRSVALGVGSFTTDRRAFRLTIGQPFALQEPEQGVHRVICRVTNIDYGSLDDPTVKVDFAEDVFSVAGATLGPDIIDGTPSTQPHAGAPPPPTVDVAISETDTTGTVDLTIDDPFSEVVSVEFGVQLGNGAVTYAVDTFPYSKTVTLNADLPTAVYYRVTYLEVDGNQYTIEGSHTFSQSAHPAPPRLSVTFDASGVATIDSVGDSLTDTQKIAVSTTAYPSDTDVRAEAPQAGQHVTLTGPTLTAGQTLYVAAFAYDVTGALESVKAIGAFTYVDATSAVNTYTLVYGWGDKSTVVLAAADASLPAPWAGTIIGWTAWTDDGANVTADFDIMRSAAVDPPVFASLVGGGTKPFLTAQRWRTSAPTGWTSVAVAAGDIIAPQVNTTDGVAKSLRLQLMIQRS